MARTWAGGTQASRADLLPSEAGSEPRPGGQGGCSVGPRAHELRVRSRPGLTPSLQARPLGRTSRRPPVGQAAVAPECRLHVDSPASTKERDWGGMVRLLTLAANRQISPNRQRPLTSPPAAWRLLPCADLAPGAGRVSVRVCPGVPASVVVSTRHSQPMAGIERLPRAGRRSATLQDAGCLLPPFSGAATARGARELSAHPARPAVQRHVFRVFPPVRDSSLRQTDVRGPQFTILMNSSLSLRQGHASAAASESHRWTQGRLRTDGPGERVPRRARQACVSFVPRPLRGLRRLLEDRRPPVCGHSQIVCFPPVDPRVLPAARPGRPQCHGLGGGLKPGSKRGRVVSSVAATLGVLAFFFAREKQRVRPNRGSHRRLGRCPHGGSGLRRPAGAPGNSPTHWARLLFVLFCIFPLLHALRWHWLCHYMILYI